MWRGFQCDGGIADFGSIGPIPPPASRGESPSGPPDGSTGPGPSLPGPSPPGCGFGFGPAVDPVLGTGVGPAVGCGPPGDGLGDPVPVPGGRVGDGSGGADGEGGRVGTGVGVGGGVTGGVVAGGGVGRGGGIGAGVAPEHPPTVVRSMVTAPDLASRRPATLAPVFAEIDAEARIVPATVELTSRVAELPTRQNTLQGSTPPVSTILLSTARMRVLAALKMKTESGPPRSVTVPLFISAPPV